MVLKYSKFIKISLKDKEKSDIIRFASIIKINSKILLLLHIYGVYRIVGDIST